MATYLLINFFTIIIPFLFSFHPKIRFYKTWQAFWPANCIVAVLFIAWDIVFTKWGVWGFNARYISGLKIFDLPLGEWLFFICIPYACVFTYHSLKVLGRRDDIKPVAPFISVILSILLLILAVIHWHKYYTTVTFFCGSAILLLHIKASFMGRFYLAYLILLLPFFIVNGILTGTGIENEVVWYNNDENLSIRLLTIPVEDLVYAFVLILLNISIYERILQKSKQSG